MIGRLDFQSRPQLPKRGKGLEVESFANGQ